ncbi:MAG: hypothetical protein OEX02_14255, partial [Cyclobacteriaceae bacterium]|nr:hypothetical protein [Cyclobacteriaceae bacterium]
NPVPDFEELCPAEKPVMRTLPLYLKMAAGVALLVTAGAIVYFSQSDTREEQTIIAREVEPQEQQTLDEFMSWEEPTQNLLEDF